MPREIDIPKAPEPKKIPTRLITSELRKVMASAHSVDKGGDVVTVAQHFARLLVNMALGYTEELIDDRGIRTAIKHLPEQWAFVACLDRYEGKPRPAEDDETPRLEADARIMQMVKDRLNSLAKDGQDGATADISNCADAQSQQIPE